MAKFTSLLLTALLPLSLSAVPIGKIIDMNAVDNIMSVEKIVCKPGEYDLGFHAFNYAPELTPFFAYLKSTYNIPIAFETGTLTGNTSVLFSFLFDEVHTVEVVDTTYQIAKQQFTQFPNINAYLGNSPDVLREVLPSLENQRVLFYLDAHWESVWPLLDEIATIAETHKDNCIIVIDDFKVPGRPDIFFDRYEEKECSYEYVKEALDKVFTSYTYHYIIPSRIYSNAKFIAIPTKWKD